MGARDRGRKDGEGLGRKWRMGGRDRGEYRDRGRIGKGVENGSKRQGRVETGKRLGR